MKPFIHEDFYYRQMLLDNFTMSMLQNSLSLIITVI